MRPPPLLDALRKHIDRMESEIQRHRENAEASLLRADEIQRQKINLELFLEETGSGE